MTEYRFQTFTIQHFDDYLMIIDETGTEKIFRGDILYTFIRKGVGGISDCLKIETKMNTYMIHFKECYRKRVDFLKGILDEYAEYPLENLDKASRENVMFAGHAFSARELEFDQNTYHAGRGEFIAFSVRSTRSSVLTGQIYDMAAVRYQQGEKTGEISMYVKISPEEMADRKEFLPAEYLRHFDTAMSEEDACREFYFFISDLVERGGLFVCHGGKFDISLIRRAFSRCNIHCGISFLDTLRQSIPLYPEASNHGLADMTELFYGEKCQLPRAEDRVQLNALLFLDMLRRKRRGG